MQSGKRLWVADGQFGACGESGEGVWVGGVGEVHGLRAIVGHVGEEPRCSGVSTALHDALLKVVD